MKSPSLFVLIPKVKEVATVCTERSLDEGFHWYAKLPLQTFAYPTSQTC